MEGRITSIKKSKGFGFIRDADSIDYFFHANSCITPYESLQEGDSVIFEPFVQDGGKDGGHRARRVTLLEGLEARI